MDIKEAIALDKNADGQPYVLFTLGKNIYGIRSDITKSIEILGKVTSIIDSHPSIRGGVSYRNHFIPLIDLRQLFGLKSQLEEIEVSIQPEQRIRDHDNWVTELEKSVNDQTEFTLTDDPHQCAFGRWYYSFESDNNVLRHQLKAVEAPHAAVHNTAAEVRRLMKNNDVEAAKAAVKKLRATHYRNTVQILSSLRDILAKNLKELYLVIESNGVLVGIIVDAIAGVEYVRDTLQIDCSESLSGYIKYIGRRIKDNEIIFILDDTMIAKPAGD